MEANKSIKEMQINIGKEFSEYIGGRFKKIGPHSGEEFYDSLLETRYLEAKKDDLSLHIYMDDVKTSYPSSFVDQSFGKLGREYDKKDLKNRVIFYTKRFDLVVDVILNKLWSDDE